MNTHTATSTPTIDVSIVTFNTPESELRKCLDCLIDSKTVGTIHIIDNSSRPYIAEICSDYANRIGSLNGKEISYTPHPNTGYGAAHNVALRRSIDRGIPYHLVINSDVYFSPGTLEACLNYMDTHPATAQLIPHTIYPDGSEQYVIHPLPTPLDMAMRAFIPEKLFKTRRRRYTLADRNPNMIVNAPYHHGCFMLLRTDALRDSGLFDERFFMYPEDIDLTRRIHRHHLTEYFPGATIIHDHRAESKKSGRMMKIHIINMLKYFRKWGFFFDKERRQFNRRLLKVIEPNLKYKE